MLNSYGETHIVFCKESLWHPKNYNIYHVQFFPKFWTNKATLIPAYSYQILLGILSCILVQPLLFSRHLEQFHLSTTSFNGYTISDAITFTKSDFTRSWPGLFLLPRFLMIFNSSLSSVGLKKQVELKKKILPLHMEASYCTSRFFCC